MAETIRRLSLVGMSAAETTQLLHDIIEDKAQRVKAFCKDVEDNKEMFLNNEREVGDYTDSIRIMQEQVHQLKDHYMRVDDIIGDYISLTQIEEVERHEEDPDLS